jgi:hypothetical protein
MAQGLRRGRPRKPADTLRSGQFGRDVVILSTYGKVRAGGKQSQAVKEVVTQIEAQYPRMRISESTVRRTLARWWPQGSHSVILFQEPVPSEESNGHQTWVREQIALIKFQGVETEAQVAAGTKPHGRVLSICFGARPEYARFNRKSDQP